jgi:CxxC motif-containing protein (DUF1111 family)/uncharacterized iron-regulated protein
MSTFPFRRPFFKCSRLMLKVIFIFARAGAMNTKLSCLLLAGALAFPAVSLVGCSSDSSSSSPSQTAVDPLAEAGPVVAQHAKMVTATYTDCVNTAKALQTAIDAFLASPSEATLDAAKKAWIASRVPYAHSEVYRFYGGPIDNETTGPEPFLNGWPLDENFIDYTRDEPQAGIINRPDLFPTLTAEIIRGENEKGGEKNLATGYHAIEFLLWGQDDLDPNLGTQGHRPFTDYVVGATGTAQNQDRRAQYLKIVTAMLVSDLESVAKEWEAGQANYAASFVKDSKQALTHMLTGMGSLANAELSGERMTVAYKNRTQEDEHSCFSDNTNADLLGNFEGLRNVYQGSYGSDDGPGIDDLIRKADPALDEAIKANLVEIAAAFQTLQGMPFDKALITPDSSPERQAMLKAIQGLKKLSQQVVQVGQALGINFKLEEPSQSLLPASSPYPRLASGFVIMRFHRTILIFSSLLFLVHCSSDPSEPAPATSTPNPTLAFSGGDTTVFDNTRAAFSSPAANLNSEQRDRFFLGNALFNRGWVTAPASVADFDGLGPMFNATNCSGCHFKDGRGRPPLTKDEPFLSMLIRLSVPGEGEHGDPVPEPNYGGQLQGNAILGVPPEGDAQISYTEQPGSYSDGESYSLRKPTYTIENLGYGPMSSSTMMSPRTAPGMVGLGLLEALSEATILERSDPNDQNNDGISGRPNYVWDAINQKKSLGRFGWKANQPSLRQQTAGAFNGDMGITSTLFPQEGCTATQMQCLQAPTGSTTPQLADHLLADVVFYAQTLAVPARRHIDQQNVLHGEQLFTNLGCQSCHVSELTTGDFPEIPELGHQKIHPYTDLLLHDMGEELADQRPDFEATGVEWRTPPLWGIGLVETVNKHQFFMHDGRARGFAEAILWHGGEAQGSRDQFKQLSRADREALVAFLSSL